MKAFTMLWCAVVAIALFLAPWPTRAEPKPGIWQEGSFNMDGETVVRFRDTTHGSNNVCYFVHVYLSGESDWRPREENVAISCVREP